jgi:hypothetical protein
VNAESEMGLIDDGPLDDPIDDGPHGEGPSM